MSSDKGLTIQIELKRQKKTQRWLLDKLHERGFVTVDEQLLSKILNGVYTWKLGRDVVTNANDILGLPNETEAESA